MAKKEKMSTQIIIPKTKFILEGILEDLAKDLGLTVENKPLPDEDYTANSLVKGPNFTLDYQRWYMDEEIEDEHLTYTRGNIEAYAHTGNQNFVGPDENHLQKRDLLYFSYKIPKQEVQKHRLFLAELSQTPGDLAVRLAIGPWHNDMHNEKKVCQWNCNYPDEGIFNALTAEEIYRFLKNQISLSK
ncbi:MAG: hypothetical protein Q8R00_00340 [Candidatus Nanoarchaeia archaeon]|nr:hypothetical protein [Candidatus Nanoarchaeia archaeon]